jgi:HSP20 family protein
MFSLIPWREGDRAARPVARLGDEFRSLFDRFLGGLPLMMPPLEMERLWNLEVNDAENEVVVRAEIPGFELPELHLELRNNRLLIRAEKKRPADDKGVEVVEHLYERTLDVPAEVDPEHVTATYRNGILEVHLAKVEAARTRAIPIT